MTERSRPPGLIQRYREELQVRHDALRTVATYEQWLRGFLRFHGMRDPRSMGEAEIRTFLSHLAAKEKGQCLNAEPGPGGLAVSLPHSAGR